MKERIRKIMEEENMTPARFADSLEIGRAVISHILNGRNNPSLDIVTRILGKMPEINPEWLLTGNGTMYKKEKVLQMEEAHVATNDANNGFPDLFSQLSPENQENQYIGTPQNEYRKENIVNNTQNDFQKTINERIIYKELPAKKIKQIIIYYSDNTFEAFNHE